LRLIAENTREPEERTLDLQAQIAANDLGTRRMLELVAQVGIETVSDRDRRHPRLHCAALRNRIAQLKPGAYTFTTYLDDDGGGNQKAPITVTVRVEGGTKSENTLDFDFAGAAPQSKGALNVPESGLKATVFYAVKALLDPGLLPNSGLFEAVRISAPEGSIVNPRFPAAVGARSITCQKIAGAIFGAFRGLLRPEEVMASSNDVLPAIVFSGRHRRHQRTYVYLETLGGGAGRGSAGTAWTASRCMSPTPRTCRSRRSKTNTHSWSRNMGCGEFRRRRSVARRARHRAPDPRAGGRHRVRLPQRLASDAS